MFSNLIKDFVEKQAKDAISKKLGIDSDIIGKVDTDMIGSLIGGLTKNAKSGGAGNILDALDKDHDGGMLDNLEGLLGNSDSIGGGILKHVLGNKQAAVEGYIAKKYNLDATMVSSMMKVIAPVVMGYLGKQQKSMKLNAESFTKMLQKEEDEILASPNNNTNPLIAFLDKDGDGDVDAMDFIG